MTGPPPRADRIYLGWEYAELHPDPGPPPGRPALPGPEQLSPGWLAAQQREERRLSRPLWLGGGSGLGLAGLAAVLGLLGVLNAALTVAGLGCFMLLAAGAPAACGSAAGSWLPWWPRSSGGWPGPGRCGTSSGMAGSRSTTAGYGTGRPAAAGTRTSRGGTGWRWPRTWTGWTWRAARWLAGRRC